MSNFVTTNDVKEVLGICDDTEDVRISAILDGVLEGAFAITGNIEKGTKSELLLIDSRTIRSGFLPLTISPIESISSIDGTDFTSKVNGTDYLIHENDTVQVTNLSTFISMTFDSFRVEYIAGYENAPKDFVDIIAQLVGLELSKDNGKDVIEETTGPRTVKWSDPSRSPMGSDSARKSLQKKLRKYQALHLRIS